MCFPNLISCWWNRTLRGSCHAHDTTSSGRRWRHRDNGRASFLPDRNGPPGIRLECYLLDHRSELEAMLFAQDPVIHFTSDPICALFLTSTFTIFFSFFNMLRREILLRIMLQSLKNGANYEFSSRLILPILATFKNEWSRISAPEIDSPCSIFWALMYTETSNIFLMLICLDLLRVPS